MADYKPKFPNLEAEMARWGDKGGTGLAPVIHTSINTAQKKLFGDVDFKRGEMLLVKKKYGGTLEYLFEEAKAE
jgi:hypothetical protein